MTTLELTDPLAELLGARRPGETFRYTYDDAVKLAGHSCPTVAGAWLIVQSALEALYGPERPVRGAIEVTVGTTPGEGGPMAQVFTLVTGAAGETGFHGLMGRHRREGLLRFDPSLEGRVRFRRTDTGDAVLVSYDPSSVPAAPDMGRLLALSLGNRASPEDRARFAELWQARVREILTGPRERVVRVTKVTAAPSKSPRS